ncbi:hypothetical protein L7F22_062642 [Adiantum nelumboides]|nr:hypothetical protein [Adiantum nelumboides]
MHERFLKDYGNEECEKIASFYGVGKMVGNVLFAPIVDAESCKVEFRNFKRHAGIDFSKMSLIEVSSLLANNVTWKDMYPNIIKRSTHASSSYSFRPKLLHLQSPIFSVHAAPSLQPPSQTMLTQGSSSQNMDSLPSLLKSLGITAWLHLYAMAREGTPAAIKRMQDLTANFQIITNGDARELKEWLEQSPALMRQLMELHGKKLRNDPIARQKRKALLSGFFEVSLSPSPTTDSFSTGQNG